MLNIYCWREKKYILKKIYKYRNVNYSSGSLKIMLLIELIKIEMELKL